MIACGGKAGSSVHNRQVARMQKSESIETSERCMYQAGPDRQQKKKLIHNTMHMKNNVSTVSFETIHSHFRFVTSIT